MFSSKREQVHVTIKRTEDPFHLQSAILQQSYSNLKAIQQQIVTKFIGSVYRYFLIIFKFMCRCYVDVDNSRQSVYLNDEINSKKLILFCNMPYLIDDSL